MGLFDGIDTFGLTRNLNFIDDATRAAKRAPKLIETAGRSVINEAKEAGEYGLSGEKFLNDPLKYSKYSRFFPGIGQAVGITGTIAELLGNPQRDLRAGSRARSGIESSPVLGNELGSTFDALASPLSLATLGSGGIGMAGGRGVGGFAARAALNPVATGGFKQRLAGETAAAFGANLGMSGIQKAPIPDEAKMPLGIAAGILGGGLGASAVNKRFGRNLPPGAPDATPQSRRGYINEELSASEIARALNLDKKMINQLRTLEDKGVLPPDVRDRLKRQYIDKYGAEPIRGVSRSTSKYGQQAVPSPDEDLGYTLEKSLEDIRAKKGLPGPNVVPDEEEYFKEFAEGRKHASAYEGPEEVARISKLNQINTASDRDLEYFLEDLADPDYVDKIYSSRVGFKVTPDNPAVQQFREAVEYEIGRRKYGFSSGPTGPAMGVVPSGGKPKKISGKGKMLATPSGERIAYDDLPPAAKEAFDSAPPEVQAQFIVEPGTIRPSTGLIKSPEPGGSQQQLFNDPMLDVPKLPPASTGAGSIGTPPNMPRQTTLEGFPAPRPSEAARMSNGAWENFNSVMRALWTPVDASIAMIQGLVHLGSNPADWGRAIGVGIRTVFSPKYYDEWAEKLNQRWVAEGKPTIADRVTNGLHLDQHGTVPGTNVINPVERGLRKLKNIPVVGQVTAPARLAVEGGNRFFVTGLNAMRLLMSDVLIDQASTPGLRAWLGTGTVKGGAKAHMSEIMAATNRATGTTNNNPLGKLGDVAFFAPKFLTANIELVLKAFQAGTVDGAIARRQLAKLIGTGVILTETYNNLRGYDTDYDPFSNNFLRMRDVGGADVSVFGYLDTIVRGVALSGKGILGEAGVTIPGQEQGSITDALYVLRSKASPAASMAIDLMTGKNFAGNNPLDFEELARYPLPFSIRDIGREPIASIGLGATGLKASPLTEGEKLDRTLTEAGINKSDPDYDIKRKQYLAENPEAIPEKKGKFREAQEITDTTNERKRILEEEVTTDKVKLADYRERRKDILLEQRARLDQLNPDFKKRNTPQAKWIDSYYNLFKISAGKTGELDTDAFDKNLSAWIDTNGESAYDYVQRYSLAGKGEVESQYIKDLRALDKAGYFDMNRYRRLRSGRDEDELEDLRKRVSAEISVDPRLQKLSFALATTRVLRGMPREVILDVINMGKKAYQNPEFAKFQAENKHLLQWFNPNATWSTYNKAKDIVSRTSQRKAS